MKTICFKRETRQSLPNLHSASVNGEIVGFYYKPNDSKSDRNAWRSYVGIGDAARFLQHTWTQADAEEAVRMAVLTQADAEEAVRMALLTNDWEKLCGRW